ncbi:arsenic resistance protein [Kocuria soli]|uniref:arsenic resistance protein n=1 Tax=Kocuria soli TaxID=2485125 RepID=UPI001F2A9E49|nr:bile acid:sodium symporter [Kocuria soli]
MTAWLERHQAVLYLFTLVIGMFVGHLLPSAVRLEPAVNPAIALLLLSTFLSIPLVHLAAAFRDLRFLGVLLLVNFLVAPVVVWVLSRFVVHDRAVLTGLLLVLLAPCVNWVIVFTGLAGGDRARMTAASPTLMLAQMLLLPALLMLIGGPGVGLHLTAGPFLTTLLWVFLLPLGLAVLVQLRAPRLERIGQALMVPTVMAVLFLVTASQSAAVGSQIGQIMAVVPLFVAFVLIMTTAGLAVGRLFRLPEPSTRAVMFSAVARNSLVVLPFALALPPGTEAAALVVVTQTMVELVALVVLVRIAPRLSRVAEGRETGGEL